MIYIIIGLFASVIAAWIWAEYKVKNPATRITFGGAAILMICAALYASEVRNYSRDAHFSAALRVLNETFENEDFDFARKVAREHSDRFHSNSNSVLEIND